MGATAAQGLIATQVSTDAAVHAGTGTTTGKPSCLLNVNTTSQATTGTSEEVLATYTLPANSLSATGKIIRVTAYFTTAANANTKIARIRLGGLTGAAVTAQSISTNNGVVMLCGYIIRTGANTQAIVGHGIASSGAVTALNSTSTQTDTGSLAIVITGATATSSGDLTFRVMIVEFMN